MITLKQQTDGKVHASSPKYKEIMILRDVLKFEHPEKERVTSYNEYDAHGHRKWDGYIRYFDNEAHTFPIGFTNIAYRGLKEHGIDIHFVYLDPFESTLPINEGMREYQAKAVQAFFKYHHGIIKVPTRGGKTFIAAEIIRHYIHERPHTKVLFFTDTADLFEQAIADISKHLKIPEDHIGEIRGPKFNLKQITVCTIQSIQSALNTTPRKNTKTETKVLHKLRRKQLLAYIKEVTFVIVDECHEYASKERISILEKFMKAEAKLFISATPFKSERELDNYNLRKVSGDVIYTIAEQKLKKQGHLAKDQVVLLLMNHKENLNITADEDDEGFESYIQQVITHNKHRNFVAVNVLEICRKLDLKTLALFARKEHGYYIKSIIDDPFISGDMISKERTFLRTTFLRRKGGVLLASDVFKKGITLPEVQVLFNIGGGLEKANVTQKKGRVLGVTEHKSTAMIIDFIDEYEHFSEHSLNRLSVYSDSVGEDNLIIMDVDDAEFYNNFREVLKNWFKL